MVGELESLRSAGPTSHEVRAAVKTTRTSREEHMRSNSYWVGAVLSAYNGPRYRGNAGECLEEREALWQSLAASLEGGEHAGAERLRRGFAKLLPPETTPRATVTLRPAPAVPLWGVGLAAVVGAGALAAVAVALRRRK